MLNLRPQTSDHMERTQWILWFALIQLFLVLSEAMLSGRKLTTTSNTNSDFISIDCGASNEYTDSQTGISYLTDSGFVETGYNAMVVPDTETKGNNPGIYRQFQTLRVFPEGRRNCYTLRPKQGKNRNYLIRTSFFYGNYDGKNKPPLFDLYLGTTQWVGMYPSEFRFEDIIHIPTTDTIHICLVKSGDGVPFISALELRPLSNSIYTPPPQSILRHLERFDVGYMHPSVRQRYRDDIYYRIWRGDYAYQSQRWNVFTKSVDINPQSTNDSYKLPARVLQSAATSSNRSSALNFDCLTLWGTPPYSPVYKHYVYFHFAEIEELPLGQKRVVNISVNGADTQPMPVTLEYLKPQTVSTVTNQNCIRFNISSTSESAAPPILNALEFYEIISPLIFPTHQTDVDAILDIKTRYQISKLDWQGDPCFPNYTWEGLICNPPTTYSYGRITSLNLSMSKLIGGIAISFSNLTELNSLDLSDNNLSGTIPEFLSKLPKLKVLNLRSNKLTGSIPKILKEKSDLDMSLDGNPDLCLKDSCKKHKFVIPLIASVSALIVIILVSLGIWILGIKRQKGHESSQRRNRAISYSKVLEITNNLQNPIGKGGFGKVYLGTLNGTQVAVKVLSQSSKQGDREFRTEVELLMGARHRHVVSLIEYCEETDARALVYEYMAKGDLRQHLSGDNEGALEWEKRLQIALGAARGLEYLHNGCKPAIVHRDLKPANILLDEKMEAKIADFGLSRAFPNDSVSHISTNLAGTWGYFAPEVLTSHHFTKGSDIYSFGIILLELITGQPAVNSQQNDSPGFLPHRVTPKVQNKEIESIVDPRLRGKYGVDSVWKFLEIAMSCTAPSASGRPDISQVVYELRGCLAIETSLESYCNPDSSVLSGR